MKKEYKMIKVLSKIAVVLAIAGSSTAFFGCFGDSSDSSSTTTSNTTTTTTTSISSTSTTAKEVYVGTPTAVTYNIRSETTTITDSGRIDQKMDIVPFSDNYKAKALYNAGYTKLKVDFSFDVKEIDDGYQYVFLYYNTSCDENNIVDEIVDLFDDSDPSLLYTYKFEHTSGKKDTNWATHTFSTSVSMSSIKDDLYIRYGASGKNEDDWQNKNVVVTLTPYKGA